MTARHLLLAGALALPALFTRATAGPRPAAAQTSTVAPVDAAETFATEPPDPWADADPADSLYVTARDALNRGDFDRAARLFARVNTRYPDSQYAGDAVFVGGDLNDDPLSGVTDNFYDAGYGHRYRPLGRPDRYRNKVTP